MLKIALSSAALACLWAADATAQQDADGPWRRPDPQVAARLEGWRAEHGDNWFQRTDPRTGYTTMLYGGRALPSRTPASEHEWVDVADEFLLATEGLHGIESATLVPERPKLMPLGRVAGGTDKMTLRYRQEVDGVPVEGAFVNALLAMDGSLLSIQSTAVPGLVGAETSPIVAAADALRLARAAFGARVGAAPTTVGDPALAFVRVERAGQLHGALAWRIELRRQRADGAPDALRYSIDARDGAVLQVEPLVHHDITGTVMTNATPGVLPDGPSNPPTQQPVPFVHVTSPLGSAVTDANGNFTIAGANGSTTVTVGYVGDHCKVDNQAGQEHRVAQSASSSQPVSILLNPTPSETVTAEANAYMPVDAARDWLIGVDPTETTLDFQVLAFANINADCNAYYDGFSINFFTSGSGCVNTAYSTVVVHELGHWLNDLYGTFNGNDGMGEGNADVFAMYVYDTAVVGEEFVSGGYIRDGNNTRMFCGDCAPGCYGEVHDDGEPWMGAAWKIRQNLNTTHGNAMGDMIADALFLGWMQAYDQQEIKSIIEEQWLVLDDDDGDLTNGTPNFADIDAGFQAQAFPGFTPEYVEYAAVTELLTTPDESGPYTVQADVTATHMPLSSVVLQYSVDGGPFVALAMANVAGNTWEAAIPGQVAPAKVRYYIDATDANSNPGSFPADAPATTLSFDVGILTTFVQFDFEATTDEGWISGDAADTATTGLWERGDPLGTGAQPEDDHSVPGDLCWFTGQGTAGGGLGENDIDGGRTTLLSPVFDATALDDPRISYWRWFSNNTGASPNDDILQVDVSNNGGATWTNAETVGPAGCESNGGWYRHEFALADFVSITQFMRVRFVAADDNDGSVVEAAIDDVTGVDIKGSGFGTRYCTPAVANSSGDSGRIDVIGSNVAANDDLTLSATGLPTSPNIGYFMMGQGMNSFTPATAAGPLCVAPAPLKFLPAPENTTQLGGGFSRFIGTSGPVSSNITAGSTWNFQAWFRDSRMGTSNLTDAVSVTFQ